MSFTRRSVGERLRRDFTAGQDVLIYVGTTDPTLTESAEHRSRLISAVTIEPNHILATRKIVPPDIWARSLAVWGDRWPHSIAVLDAANIVGPPYPDAHEVIPKAYRSFAQPANRGGIVEALETERGTVMGLPVERVDLHLREDVVAYIRLRESFGPDVSKAVNAEVTRMAASIIDSVKRGGEPTVRINPQRTAPNFSDLYQLLLRRWKDGQSGLCNLCGGKLIAA
jgi:hypothetical protein